MSWSTGIRKAGPWIITAAAACAKVLASSISQRRAGEAATAACLAATRWAVALSVTRTVNAVPDPGRAPSCGPTL
ncbi:hypothetical protein GCM10027026_14480 [Myroides odoratimimus subsp. xuanwuensis]